MHGSGGVGSGVPFSGTPAQSPLSVGPTPRSSGAARQRRDLGGSQNVRIVVTPKVCATRMCTAWTTEHGCWQCLAVAHWFSILVLSVHRCCFLPNQTDSSVMDTRAEIWGTTVNVDQAKAEVTKFFREFLDSQGLFLFFTLLQQRPRQSFGLPFVNRLLTLYSFDCLSFCCVSVQANLCTPPCCPRRWTTVRAAST
jgi:hypothetical protein